MRKIFISLALFAGLTSQALAADNYAATAGAGLTFGAKDAAGVLYSRFIGCDNTTVAQCWSIDASGRMLINVGQINGVTPLMGNGATGTGSQRVTIANDNTLPTGWPTPTQVQTVTTWAGGTLGAMATYGTSPGAVLVPGVNAYVTNTLTGLTPGDTIATGTYTTGSPTLGATLLWNGTTYDRWKSVATGVASIGAASGSFASGAFASGALASGSIATGAMVDFLTTVGSKNAGTAATSAQLGGGVYNSTPLTLTNTQQASTQTDVSGYVKVRPSDGTKSAVLDPCEANLQTYTPISITTATTTRIVAPSASNKTYICSLFLTSAAADNVGIVEGTGGTCGTGTAGVVGGTTAANGPNFAANGGVMLQAGGKVAVAQTAGTNVDLCLITSAATPLAGGIKFVQAP